MFLFVIIFIILFFNSFYYGKLGMMGNFAEWRNERGCTRYVEYLPDRTYQSLNKDARVKLYIYEAKPCILFCLAPSASVSLLDKGGLYECQGVHVAPWLHSFHSLQKVSGQQIFEKCLIFFSLKVFHHFFDLLFTSMVN